MILAKAVALQEQIRRGECDFTGQLEEFIELIEGGRADEFATSDEPTTPGHHVT